MFINVVLVISSYVDTIVFIFVVIVHIIIIDVFVVFFMAVIIVHVFHDDIFVAPAVSTDFSTFSDKEELQKRKDLVSLKIPRVASRLVGMVT